MTGSDLAVVLLCLLAPALGGATQLWEQAILGLGLAVILLWIPPRRWMPRGAAWGIGGLLVLASLGFLPAAWFKPSAFRQALTTVEQVPLPSTLSFQPWQSLEGLLLLAGSATWLSLLVCRDWHSRRAAIVSVYVGGIISLAAAAIVFRLVGWQPPFWNPQNGPFGFFPNRSQTGVVLSSAGILCLALGFRSLLRKRKSGFGWAAGYFLLLFALVENRDWPSLVLCLVGCSIWLVWSNWPTRQHRTLGIGLASSLLLPAALLLVLGVLPRPGTPKPAPENRSAYSPWKVQADALRLYRDASWHGIGLGNFEPAFAQYRVMSRAQDRVRHPESDWLWTGIELGWFAPLLVVGALFALLRRQWPDSSHLNFRLRSALTVCVLLYAVDASVHVPGHRVGSIWPCLFFLGLVREDPFRERSGAALWFRGLGVISAVVGAVWLLSSLGFLSLPTSARASQIRARIQDALRLHRFDEAMALANEGLRWAPLSWEFRFERALAEVATAPSVFPAMQDFGWARFLEPNIIQVPADEARVWLKRLPRLAFPPWVEALRRAGPHKTEVFRTILEEGQAIPTVREELFSLTDKDLELLMVYLSYASPEEFKEELNKLLADDSNLKTLTARQRGELFRLWGQKGDAAALVAMLQDRPEWLETAWPGLAQVETQRGEWEQACQLAQRYAPTPRLPRMVAPKAVEDLARQFGLSSNDFSAGFALYQLQLQAQDGDRALDTLTRMTNQKACPGYFHYLEARLRGDRGEWELAWKAWERYLARLPAPSEGL